MTQFDIYKQDNDHLTNLISNQIIKTDLKNNSNSNYLINQNLENQDSENQNLENQNLENQDEEIKNLDLTPRSPKSGRSLLPGGITEKERSELSPNSFYDYLFQRNRFSLK